MKQLVTLFGLVACLAICTMNSEEARATCKVMPGQGGENHYPVWQQRGRKVLVLHGLRSQVVYIVNKGNSSIQDCKPVLMYDTSKMTCTRRFWKKDLENDELEDNWRVSCRLKSGVFKMETELQIYAMGKTVVEVLAHHNVGVLLAIVKKLSANMKALSTKVEKAAALAAKANVKADNAAEAAGSAYGVAIEAKKRKSANISIAMEGFISPVTQGMSIKDYPAGGVGFRFTYWFLETAKFKQVKLGAMVGLRWHRMMLTIDGGPEDSDVPGDQYDLLFNLHFRWKPLSWLSFNVWGGLEWIFFHHQDHISDNDPVAGPNGNISQSVGLNLGGAILFHIGQFYFGPGVMGALIFDGLYHPDFEGEARFGTVKHFYASAYAGVRF